MEQNTNQGTSLTFDEILADKTYQAEFDRRVTQAINTAKEKWNGESKTTTDKMNADLDQLRKEKEDLQNQITALNKTNLTIKSIYGVDDDEVEFTQFKVGKMEGQFEENLKSYLENKPKYLQKEVTADPKEDTGVAVTKTNEKAESGVTAILKEKHPELFN